MAEVDATIGKSIILENLTEKEVKALKNELTMLNPYWTKAVKYGRRTFGIQKYIKQYEEYEGKLLVPRGFLYRAIEIAGGLGSIKENTANPPVIHIDNKITLKEVQIPWVESMLKHRQGVGVAAAGLGKTVMALHMIADIGLPTLWLTSRDALIEQVKKEIHKHLGLENVGIIGAGKRTIGEAITIGMVPTLVRNETLMQSLAYNFGVIVVDECQHVPSSTFIKVINKFAPKYLYGLTATPYREDALEQLMLNYIGPIIAEIGHDKAVETKSVMNAKVIVRNTGIIIPPVLFGADYAELVEHISKSEKRNNLILSDILYEYGLGNTCMVLTTTTDHIDLLAGKLTAMGIEVASPHSKKNPRIKTEQLEKFINSEVKILIVTYGLLAEGFSHQPSNRLFLVAPLKSSSLIVQSTGRIERTLEGKENAIVYDYVDNIPLFKRQFEKRKRMYSSKNMLIRYT